MTTPIPIALSSGTFPVSRRRRRERWTRWRTRRGYAAHRVQIHGAETLEERTLLSGLSAMRPDVTLDGSVDPPYYQGATWSARDNAADTPRSIRQDAADDATDEFRWTGWHSSDLQGPVTYSATFEYTFFGSPTLEGRPDATTVSWIGEDQWRVAGEPQLPVRESAVLLPQGTQIAEVRFDLGAGIELSFPGMRCRRLDWNRCPESLSPKNSASTERPPRPPSPAPQAASLRRMSCVGIRLACSISFPCSMTVHRRY